MDMKTCYLVVHTDLLFLVIGLAASATSISSSGEVFQLYKSSGRNLLQDNKKRCPITFETANYTILTSKCMAPQYPPSLCCPAFQEFACPYATYINDETNDCDSIMFTYINLHSYPPGLFGSECRVLQCPDAPPKPAADANSSAGRVSYSLFFPLVTSVVSVSVSGFLFY